MLVDGARWLDFSEEHGELAVSGAARGLAVGDKIALVPRHGCTTVNLYDQFHVMRAGRLIDLWAVAGRGRSQYRGSRYFTGAMVNDIYRFQHGPDY